MHSTSHYSTHYIFQFVFTSRYLVKLLFSLAGDPLHNYSISESESESELLYEWRFTTNQFFLEPSLLRVTTFFFFWQLNLFGHSPYVTYSLTRERERECVCVCVCVWLYDWRFTANQFVLALSLFRLTTRDFFEPNPWGRIRYVSSSLTRGWISCLKVLDI
jgi:hypothetical protein